MDADSFFIEYTFHNREEMAEVRPCCEEKNVYYYDVLINNEYHFTVTPMFDEKTGLNWKISLRNADRQVDAALIDVIGYEIEKHLLQA